MVVTDWDDWFRGMAVKNVSKEAFFLFWWMEEDDTVVVVVVVGRKATGEGRTFT